MMNKECENEDRFILFFTIFSTVIILNNITPWKETYKKDKYLFAFTAERVDWAGLRTCF